MSEEQNTKKVIPLRTFADDVKRAREKQDRLKPKPEKNVEKKEPDAKEEKLTPKPEEDKKENVAPIPPKNVHDGVEFEEPAEDSLEIPPFHFIRASSPDNTTYTDEEDIPDKKSLKKETIRKTKPPEREHIPTHELDVDTDSIPEHQESILTNRDGVFDTEEAQTSVGEGSIVLDRKRKKFKLFPAIISAFKHWFGSKREALALEKKPKYTVEKSERRKEVIEQAAKQTKQAPVDDHEAVSKKLKDVERITDVKDLQIKDEESVPEPTWQHIDEKETKHDEAIESLQLAVSGKGLGAEVDAHVEEKEELHKKETQQVEEEIVENEENERTEVKNVSKQGESGYSKYREKYGDEYAPSEEAFDESLPPAPETVDQEEIERPKFKQTDVPDYKLNKVGRKIKRKQGTPYLTIASVIIIAIILGTVSSVWFFTRNSDDSQITENVPDNGFIETSTSVGIPFDPDREIFFESLNEKAQLQSSVFKEFHPTKDGVLVSPDVVLTSLFENVPGSLARSVNEISFGKINNSVPFIVMRFNSFDTVFGEILEWENELYADLSPLFGTPMQTRGIDSKTNNRDVRVLVGEDGQDKVVYGFTDKNTLLITTNKNIYSAIAPQVK